MKPTLWLVRHGATELNKADGERVRGHLQLPLTDKGQKQALRIGAHLSKFPVDSIYHSDLQHAAETAKIISHITGAQVHPDRDLRTWDPGAHEGQKVRDVMPILKHLAHRQPNVATPGGESFHAWAKKFLPKLDKHLDELKRRGGHRVLVTHGRNIELAQSYLSGRRKKLDHKYLLDKKYLGPPGSALPVEVDGDEWKAGEVTTGGGEKQ